MQYLVTVISPNGYKTGIGFSSKTTTKRWVKNNNHFFPIDKIERITKNETRDVTEEICGADYLR